MLVEIWEDDLKFFEELLSFHGDELRIQINSRGNRVGTFLGKAIDLEIKRVVDTQLRLSVALEGGKDSSRLPSDFESLVRSINNDSKECALSATKSIAKVCGVNI